MRANVSIVSRPSRRLVLAENEIPRDVPEEIDIHRRLWVRFNHRWKALHYTLGVVATCFAITVAAQPGFLKAIPHLLEAIAWASAVCVALITFLMPSRRARSYVGAARILTDACNRYRLDPNFRMKQLLDAVKEGEDLISRGEDP
jgi:hypothetical protein